MNPHVRSVRALEDYELELHSRTASLGDSTSRPTSIEASILLMGPGGQTSMLLSDAGGSYDIDGVSLTFDAAGLTTLTSGSQISGGTYKPVNYGLIDRLPSIG